MSATPNAFRCLTATFALLITVAAGLFAVASPAQAARSTAYQVTVVRTGGFAGVDESYTVTSQPGSPFAATLMESVSSREFRSLAPSYLPTPNGADRFRYTVTVAYSNGRTKTVVAVDGADAPAVLWQVVDTTMRIAAGPTVAATN
ncbi:protealysin inhibitor emfourin [Micromonospora siamensis]|uniref:Uncharacterized protein n=1 Tax=Micromonospora siamensis TaxID=299152 RepID=A0A1C5GRZ1_9ACTN|nr:protealysin inhibitor emfourin [Micromonospora siamensis]SCG36555.1 hypothetical protein GA0074704_0395 [Micromonospora siamensis]